MQWMTSVIRKSQWLKCNRKKDVQFGKNDYTLVKGKFGIS